MRILHYTLGVPPYRSGGLTKYATDLMSAQSACGDMVSLLYPGDYTFWRVPKIKIIRNEKYNGVSVYEIKNPSLVPLLYGVRNPSDVLEHSKKLSEQILEQFYTEVKPDVMHIHTLMGLPLELVVYLKEKGVKIVFTSHDYYGLCPKVNFINQNGVFCNSPGGKQCALCNKNAPRSLFLRLRNSKYLLKYKSKLSSRTTKAEVGKNKLSKEVYITQEKSDEYTALLDYYKKLFELIDCFHFNSTVSQKVYNQYLVPKQSFVLPITHAEIKDDRKLKKIDPKHLRLAFIGGLTIYKGFPILKDVLCELYSKGIRNWSLQVWGGNIGVDSECERIIYKGKYTSDNLVHVFDEIDLLIVPSVWKETFSLITLEALSNGVPVLVSYNVGAKDIINGYNSNFVFHPSKKALDIKLQDILNNPSLLSCYNEKIWLNKFKYLLDDHIQKVKQLYNKSL